MDPRRAAMVLDALKQAGVSLVVGLPDSLLKGVHEGAMADPELRYVGCSNEGEGAAIAAGAYVGGKRAVLVMENSGIRVAAEALCRVGLTNNIPVPILMSFRGDFGTRTLRAHNHGITLEPFLQAMRIPYRFVDSEEDINGAVIDVVTHAISSQYHAAIIFRRPLVGVA